MTRRLADIGDGIAKYLMLDRYHRPLQKDPWFLCATILFLGGAVTAAFAHAWPGLLTSPFVFFWVAVLNLIVESLRGPGKRQS